jgi:pimeloyl-ACP methyl ester carboxylesterase
MPYLKVNGARLFYEERGEGEPLVLVHGSWDDYHTWDQVAPLLADAFRVIRYDRRGHSRSERIAGPGTRRQDEDDLAALLESLDLEPAHLVGNSFGGSIVLGLTASRPGLVRTATVHEPPLVSLVAGDPDVGPMVAEAGELIGQIAEQLAAGDTEGGTKRFMEQIALGPGAWEKLPAEVRDSFLFNAPTFVDEVADSEWSAIDRTGLRGAGVPTLLTRGEQSPAWFGHVLDVLAQLVPESAIRTFEDTGHVPHETHPQAYVAAVRDIAGAARAAA